jgi:hypothetical protein
MSVSLKSPLSILSRQEQIIALLCLIHENRDVFSLPNYNSHLKVFFRRKTDIILGYLLGDSWLEYVNPAFNYTLCIGKCGQENYAFFSRHLVRVTFPIFLIEKYSVLQVNLGFADQILSQQPIIVPHLYG